MTERHTILIIDDHPFFRKGVGQLIEMYPQFKLIGEAANGPEGIELSRSLKPDLLLLDLNMKGMNGIEVLKVLKDSDLDSIVIIMTVSDAQEDLVAALRSGADGYLLKDMEPEEFMGKLQHAVQGHMVLDETLTSLLANALRAEQQAPAATDHTLTDREREVLTLIADGMSNKLIARELDISDGTVKVHVKHMLRKLNLNSRLEAAAWAHEHGIKR